ncbi:hypothetical protein [Streptomyces pseudovenezuelae]|uniref:hypothetical protein n=1 Tax=Streptomyces pseudovenezuelae TaxID=67350 RepID=UPI002E341047|nr:hypothetical protein [Streptomyces pseudovenezuelae]
MNQQHAWDADDNKPAIPKIPHPRPAQAAEPSELAAAILVGQRMLDHYGTVDSSNIFDYTQAHGGLAEALRVLLRALDAKPLTDEERARRSVDRAFPTVAAFLAAERGEGQ